MIVIIDYGMGNIGSIWNMLKKIGADALISSHLSDIEMADKLILPGVGSFDTGMKNLNELNLIPFLDEVVNIRKIPLLGICLGMQLLTRKSEEGNLPGLGWIDAETVGFRFDDQASQLKVPHMGWNSVSVRKQSRIFSGLLDEIRFYFVHSYHVICRHSEDVLSITRHGIDFTSSVEKGNIVGVQFHPEKSHKYGMNLLKNFVENF